MMGHVKMTDEEIQVESEKWARGKGISGEVIGVFNGSTGFLSNFYNERVEVYGHVFLNNEAAFQAFKCLDRVEEFKKLPPNKAKQLGRRVKLRDDWESIKDQVMYDVVRAKFMGNEELAKKLVSTGDAYLVEGNWWGDGHWGVCRGIGKNKLGEALMKVRTEIVSGVVS